MPKSIAFIFSVLAVLFSTPNSFAHVDIVSTFPEQYTNATPIPRQVWIEFSGDLQTLEYEILNTIEVIDSTGIAVNFDDPIIEGSRITTSVSDQSAPGVFFVKYRVVGEDGHIIEGEYTFNASPDYSAIPAAKPVVQNTDQSNTVTAAVFFGVLVLTILLGYIIKMKKDKSK